MIRTRDLILFVTSFIFLLMAISGTLWLDMTESKQAFLNSIRFMPGSDGLVADVTEDEELDRAEIVKRIREALEVDTSTIEPVPSVTTEADAVVSEDVKNEPALQRCAAPDDVLSKIGLWPLAGTKVAVKEGARVFYTEATVTHTSSTTVPETVTKDYLALPLMPANGGKYCVPSEVVGVTPQGVLMLNNDTNIYATTNEHLLIGYARDGNPIYGVYDGEVDECGGYQHSAGYRYVIRPDSDYIIGCFVAPPQPFVI